MAPNFLWKMNYGMISLLAALVAVGGLLFVSLFPWMLIPLFGLVAFLLAWLVISLKWQAGFMKVLAFLLPFSVEIPIGAGSMLRVPTEPILAVALMVLLLEVARSPLKLKSGHWKEGFWLLPLLAVFVFTIPFSEMLMVSVKFSLVNILYILVFYVLLSGMFLKRPGLFPEMLILYSLGLGTVLLWSFIQYWQWEFNPVVVRGIFRPFYKDHTIFGASAALVAAFWLSWSFWGKDGRARLFALVGGFVLLGGVLLGGSRAAILSMLFFLGVALLLRLRFRVLHLAGLGLILLLMLAIFHQPLTDRLERIQAVSYQDDASLVDRTISAGNITTDLSNLERLNRWVAAWRMFRDKPLTGFGPGTYQFVYIPYQDESLMSRLTVTNPWDAPEFSGGTAHSEYLLALSEMGIFGLIAWLLLLGRWTWIAFNHPGNHPRRRYLLMAFAALSTYFLHALFNNFLTTDKFAFLFWGTAAWLIANFHLNHEERFL
jgi:putative inorganic carbon (hco3(-)) transporter